jgi:hypothetical protein
LAGHKQDIKGISVPCSFKGPEPVCINYGRANDGYITFKASTVEPDYMQESNPDGPYFINEQYSLTMFIHA